MPTALTAAERHEIRLAEQQYKATGSEADREALRDLYDWYSVDEWDRLV